MLTELIKGRKASDVAALPKEDLLEEVGVPLTPVRLKCAILGLSTPQGRAAQGEGDTLARRVGVGRRSRAEVGRLLVPWYPVCPVDELPPGEMKLVRVDSVDVGVYNIDGELRALEDRCSHDDGPLCEGDWDPEEGVVICPRHGSNFRHPHGRAAVAARLRARGNVLRARRERPDRGRGSVVLDDRVRVVLTRLEEEDAAERAAGVARELRSRQVTPATGRFLFTVVAPQAAVEILEIGGSRGYSAIWLASAARILGGTVVSLESDPAKCEAWRANIEEAGLAEWADSSTETRSRRCRRWRMSSTSCSSMRKRRTTRRCSGSPARSLELGALVIADNVLSHEELHPYSAARQADPSLVSVTVPLDRGLELSTVLSSV